MVNLRTPLQRVKIFDVPYRKGFHVPDDKVRYRETLPLALKNRVTPKSESKRKVCMAELMDVLECMGKFDQNQAMCSEEIKKFNACYSSFRATDDPLVQAAKRERRERPQPHEKGTSKKSGRVSHAGDGNNLKGELINEYLRKFPTSRRKGQHFDHSGGSRWKNME